MFEKYKFHRALYNLSHTLFSEYEDLSWPNLTTKRKFMRLFKALKLLERYKHRLNAEEKDTFNDLYQKISKACFATDDERFSHFRGTKPFELNKLILIVYNCFHKNESKNKQAAEEIKRRLEYYNAQSQVRVSASHRPQKAEALNASDLKKLSESKTLVYFHGTEHPSKSWYKIGGFFRTACKAAIIEVSKFLPLQNRIFVLRTIGTYLGNNVKIGNNVQFDYFCPELIRIEDDAKIGDNCKLWTHDFGLKSFAFAPLTIHKNAVIENNCIIGPVEIGKNSVVKSNSVVLKNIPESAIYDNSNTEYIKFLIKTDVKYENLKNKLVNWVMGFCKILPYDPVPRDIPLIGKLPYIDKLPAFNMKNRLYKLIGVKINGHITVAPRVYIDAIHPELIEIDDGTLVGDGVIFRPYDLDGNPSKITIGKNCKIGSESIIMSCRIGRDTQINMRSVVIGELPSNVIAGGAPAKVLSKNNSI